MDTTADVENTITDYTALMRDALHSSERDLEAWTTEAAIRSAQRVLLGQGWTVFTEDRTMHVKCLSDEVAPHGGHKSTYRMAPTGGLESSFHYFTRDAADRLAAMFANGGLAVAVVHWKDIPGEQVKRAAAQVENYRDLLTRLAERRGIC